MVGAYLETASKAVADVGGIVEKKLGDGLMALFGYPTAHENDAERAARAALAIQRALTELNRSNATNYRPRLAARIGTAYATRGTLVSAWASAWLSGREAGATELRQALTLYTDQGNKIFVPVFRSLLAEIEAEGDSAGALTQIDEALALAGETGEQWSDAFLHRLRGEILLKCDPTDTAPAEEAFLTAIAIAQHQKARSFELLAALDLARIYNSLGRSMDAHGLLAFALEGFSATPEFPEIEQAQMLLTTMTS